MSQSREEDIGGGLEPGRGDGEDVFRGKDWEGGE